MTVELTCRCDDYADLSAELAGRIPARLDVDVRPPTEDVAQKHRSDAERPAGVTRQARAARRRRAKGGRDGPRLPGSTDSPMSYADRTGQPPVVELPGEKGRVGVRPE